MDFNEIYQMYDYAIRTGDENMAEACKRELARRSCDMNVEDKTGRDVFRLSKLIRRYGTVRENDVLKRKIRELGIPTQDLYYYEDLCNEDLMIYYWTVKGKLNLVAMFERR